MLLLLLGFTTTAQNNPTDNLVNYDNQWIHYGFLVGIHSSKFVIQYAELFTTPDLDTVHSIVPGNLGGFKLGFLSNMKINNYLHFRSSITVGFYEYDLVYRFTDNTSRRELKDAVAVEFPLLLKYKSLRRGNLAAYLLGGITPSFEAGSRSSREDVVEKLELDSWNMAFEIGGGFDMYYPLFKFSPEIRYSYGLRNLLTEKNDLSIGLNRLATQNLSIFVTFEGGPTSKKNPKIKLYGARKQKAKTRKNKAQRKFKRNG